MSESIWYSGSITEAINEAKRLQTLFLVHVRDESEQSNELRSRVFENEDILSVLRGSVLIEVLHGTTSFAQFTQFYPVMAMPSTYFITPAGIPLEIVAGPCSTEEFLQKAQNTFQKFKSDANSSTSAQSQPASSSAPGVSSQSLDERTKYAQERLKEIRERKQVETQKEEIEKEKRRKEQMSELSKAKVEAEDRQARQIVEERRKEKEEERLAREAIKRKIAEDRAERAARFANAKAESQQSSPSKLELTSDSAASPQPASFSGIVRIQLRFPDGSHQNIESKKDSTLGEVQHIVDQDYSDLIKSSDFTLAVPYPRRVFTNNELDQTLEDLQLIPSAVLVVLPQKGSHRQTFGSSSGTAVQAVSQEGNIFGKIIAMFVAFFSFIISIFTGSRRDSNVAVGVSSASNAVQSSSSAVHFDSETGETAHDASTARESKQLRQRLNAAGVDKQKSVSKLETGNIHRLNTEDDDGENNTWNGNSTQQM